MTRAEAAEIASEAALFRPCSLERFETYAVQSLLVRRATERGACRKSKT